MAQQQKPVLMIDVDGVLVLGCNSNRTHWAEHLQRDFGVNKDALQEHFFRPYWADIVIGKDSLLPRLEQALTSLGSKIKATELRDYWFRSDACLNADVLKWMQDMRLNGHRIMLATNQDHSRAAHLMTQMKLRCHVDGMYHSAQLGVAKPNPEFFEVIAKLENRKERDLVLIDDTATNITAARTVGWRAIRYKGQSPDQLTTAIVNGDRGSASPSTTSK